MYQPQLRPDQIKRLYYLKLQRRRSMTKLLREIVDTYLASNPAELGQGTETKANVMKGRNR
jgi:hypothetical protein